MEVEVDWDLHAVVRGCCTNNNVKQQQQPDVVVAVDGVKKLDKPRSKVDSFSITTLPQPELFDLFRPFLISPVSTASTTTVELKNWQQESSISSNSCLIQPRSNNTNTTTTTSRSKRRKNQFKKVCEVPAEGLATDDTWSWRKYGQKPIKGSPYPRGYYRCSSSKGCPARKQVERSRRDPKMFIITYTSEHNHPAPTHRNSLAGISRHRNSSKVSVLPSSSPKQGASSSSVPTSPSDDDEGMQQSIKNEDYQLDEILCFNEFHQEEEEEEKKLLLDDDFFDGLDDMRLPTGQQVAQI